VIVEEDCMINIREILNAPGLDIPDIEIEPQEIKAVMINEVPPANPSDGFYNGSGADYARSVLGLFKSAGVLAGSIRDILDMGIYITTAVKSPKSGYTVDTAVIKDHLPVLKAELALFPNLQVIMLMGDVAKKAVNMLTKAETGKNVIPSGATYKIKQNAYYWGDIRVCPSYIMTGGNILIEKFKCEVIADDIKKMFEVIK
jgi:uracil-DNA glycosylase